MICPINCWGFVSISHCSKSERNLYSCSSYLMSQWPLDDINCCQDRAPPTDPWPLIGRCSCCPSSSPSGTRPWGSWRKPRAFGPWSNTGRHTMMMKKTALWWELYIRSGVPYAACSFPIKSEQKTKASQHFTSFFFKLFINLWPEVSGLRHW